MKAVALTCARCGGSLTSAPGVSLGVCNPCSTAYDFATGEKRAVPVVEPIVDDGGEVRRLPFIRFEAEGAGATGAVFVMAFSIAKIGTPYDDGSKLTVEAKEMDNRPGRLDAPPELSLETAAGLARFLSLRRFDPDGKRSLRPEAVRLRGPSVLAMPFRVTAAGLVDPISGMTLKL
jgi:hypothetical protein